MVNNNIFFSFSGSANEVNSLILSTVIQKRQKMGHGV